MGQQRKEERDQQRRQGRRGEGRRRGAKPNTPPRIRSNQQGEGHKAKGSGVETEVGNEEEHDEEGDRYREGAPPPLGGRSAPEE